MSARMKKEKKMALVEVRDESGCSEMLMLKVGPVSESVELRLRSAVAVAIFAVMLLMRESRVDMMSESREALNRSESGLLLE